MRKDHQRHSLASSQCSGIYVAQGTVAFVVKLGYEILPHAPYSLDLSPNDFMFCHMKTWLHKKLFSNNKKVIFVTKYLFLSKSQDFS